ncbi:MAG: hypothetical protein BMS9Abin05_1738 [Rhodothermia bacterium]|nr:MAG: hypothetical protein BMS9Abin05_1738 [Rhodothermia bacterium]
MIDSTISHYKIVSELGRGGMGIVYKAHDTHLDRTVALKFLPRDLTRDPVAKTRFVHEAKAASALDHSNICTVYDIGETDDGQMYIAMAYYEGSTLRDLIEEGPLSVEAALDYALQIASGLAKAHNGGIVHRDIKPANVMVTSDGQVKIVDFGLAKVAEQTQVTQEGSTLGTAAYMSPEQARGDVVDERTDQWSLGAVMYEMLSGKRAFAGEYSQAIIYSVLNDEPPSVRKLNPDVSPELEKAIQRTLKKNPDDRFADVAEIAKELKLFLDLERGIAVGGGELRRLLRKARSPRVFVPAGVGLLALIVLVVWFLGRQAKIRWASEELLPRIDQMMETAWRDYIDVYRLAEQAEKYIANDSRLIEIFAQSARFIDVQTEPLGADVYMKAYASPGDEWKFIGTSPVENVRVPIGIFRWKIEKEGYEAVLAAATTWDLDVVGDNLIIGLDFSRILDEEGSIPDGMVRVAGIQSPEGTVVNDFFIDRTEVTNRQFKDFVEAGGYRTRDYWEHEFILNEAVLSWEEAMRQFTDLTDRPGPSTWRAGDYPEGQSNYPVSGVSWYEAAAYAVWVGKSLPTGTHWGLARGEQAPLIQWPQLGGFATFAPFSNFGSSGPVEVARLPGFTAFGAYDMAGNVREWNWNETAQGRLIRGGAWNDNTYRFAELSQAPPFDRSERNGFRLAVYPNGEQPLDELFGAALLPKTPDVSKMEPVSDEIFKVYREQFFYDQTPLNARLESSDDSAEEWIHERVSYDAAYGNERIIAHLFLPKNASPPYQTVVYFPGSASLFQTSSDDMEDYYEFQIFLSFFVKNGRAALFPVYTGTFERYDRTSNPQSMKANSYAYTEYTIQLVKDFKRSLDYLETREDIDSDRIAFDGMSWGGAMGAIIPAVERRIKASILAPLIYFENARSEINQINYLPRITVPTLVLAGEYDTISPAETVQIPMFNLLGTRTEDKELKLYPTDHIPPMNEVIRETLAWLDRYLGPVER